MPRGCARPGAGRPAGSHGETAKIIQQAAEDGVLPLKIMLDNVRFYTKKADALIARLMTEGAPVLPRGPGEAGDTDEAADPNAAVIEAIGQVLGLRKLAGQEAERAAPYCHPRMGVLGEEGGTGEIEVPLAERLKEYTRRDRIEAADGKVIKLNPESDQ